MKTPFSNRYKDASDALETQNRYHSLTVSKILESTSTDQPTMKTKNHPSSTKKATTAPAKKAQGPSKTMRPAKQAAVAKLCTKADIMHPVSGSEKQVQANTIAELVAENKRLTTEVNGLKRSCKH
ncbi:unknown protein [Seminavis robusta]|uniref:Uncharacterized protein n=1 Tax=Seminavis robusta TaxID=568900 RepID=A0A9N8DXW0_9STRA|nr:unknown protein [Seminavis robusta]|eukprot:Sro363_g126970.1 n/a (125) ;mRNA; r:61975-62349